ncbi:hypothetical protein CRYUN_Cryun13aG0083000 [Craigia yunnanensis]
MLHKRRAFAIAHFVVPSPYSTNSISSVFLILTRVETMETSQPLSIESFSYNWLTALSEPHLMHVMKFPSLRWTQECHSRRFFRNSQDFMFDFPISQTPLTLVHADELFSNGYVMPFFVNPLKMEAYEVSDSTSTLPTSSHASNLVVPASKTNRPSLRRCRRLSKWIFWKYRRIRGRKSSSRAESVDARVQVMKNWVYSTETSPRISVAYSADEWRKKMNGRGSISNPHGREEIGGFKKVICPFVMCLLLFFWE